MNLLNKILNALLNEDFSIQQKLMNIVIGTAFVGAFVSFVVTLFIGADVYGALTTVGVLLVLSVALYFSIIKRKDSVAALLVIGIADVPLLAIMYFTSGGMMSGMPVWFLLGLAVPFFMLRSNRLIIPIVSVGIVVFATCILIEDRFAGLVTQLAPEAIASDIIVSIALVALVFGAIFRFQAFVYNKQTAKLKQQDEELRKMMDELQGAMKDLEAANRAKSSFLANMSHEIRTPINAVLGMDEIILRETKESNTEKYAAGIRSSGQSLLSIINDILDFSKIESGKMEILQGVYDVSSLLNDCYNMVAMRAKEKNLRFVVTNNPDLPKTLYGDEIRIRQVITNLLTNAVKYTKEGSIVFNMQFERENDKQIVLNISVKDTGKGISEEGINLLFNSFQRVDEIQNKNIEGTGLGLAISKQLVELMNGSIFVESEVGKGSTFTVKIPQVVVSDIPLGDFSQKYMDKNTENKKYEELFQAPEASILVVDDVPINLEVVKGLLKQTQVQMDFATGGEEALGYINAKKYDMVLLDHMMPGMDGVETLGELRKIPNGKDVPVVVLTANALVGAAEEYLKAGFSGYLPKPVRCDALENTLMKFLPKEKIVVNKKIKEVQIAKKSEMAATKNEAIVKTGSLVERLDFLDTTSGLLYCAGDVGLYKDILNNYIKDIRVDAIRESRRTDNWNAYRILVHSLKSSSLTIGAKDLSEKARLQELAIINGNYDEADKMQEALLADYQEIIEKISAVLNG